MSLPQLQPLQNAAFQNFFFDVCATPSAAALGARCAETPGGTGNVSGDSEDSLNPSQVVSSNEAALIRSKGTRREISERLEELRQEREEEQTSGSIQDTARWGFFVSGRGTSWDRDETTEERGSDGYVYGVQLGLDYRFTEQLLVGVLFGYESGDSEFDGDEPGVNFIPPADDGDTESDSYLLALYGSYSLNDNVYIDASIGYGLSEYDIKRKAVFQESGPGSAADERGYVGRARRRGVTRQPGCWLRHVHRGAQPGCVRARRLRADLDRVVQRERRHALGTGNVVRSTDPRLAHVGIRGTRQLCRQHELGRADPPAFESSTSTSSTTTHRTPRRGTSWTLAEPNTALADLIRMKTTSSWPLACPRCSPVAGSLTRSSRRFSATTTWIGTPGWSVSAASSSPWRSLSRA